MTTYHPETHDPIVRAGFQQGLSDHQIAARIDHGLSWQTVRRARQRMNLGPPPGKSTYRPEREPLPPLGPELTSPVQIARLTLGARLTERNGGYVLDRTPISTADMVRESNRIRLKRGQEQIGHPNWQVKP